MSQLKVSVIIPNYNHSSYLKERIDSVLNQTYKNFEVIILDDCSTDDSIKIIDGYKTNSKVSNIIYNEINSGSTFKQWNKGISLAKGDWIWIAESDDVADPALLQKLMQAVLTNENIVLSYCQSLKIDEIGEITGSWRDQTMASTRDFDRDFIAKRNEFIKSDLIHQNVIPNASAVVFKKSTFLAVNKADEDIKYNSDWLLWLKILTKGDVSFTADALNKFRYHEKSVIATSKNMEKNAFKKKFDILMFERFLQYVDEPSIIKLIKAKLSYFSELEFRFLVNNNLEEGKIFFKKGLKYNKYKIKYILRNINYIISIKCSQ
ncbi:glycosyltransferase [Empedobacter falsenii]